MTDIGFRIMQMLKDAAAFSTTDTGVTRLFCTNEHKQLAASVIGWMEEAGLYAYIDDAGNVVGRTQKAREGAPTFIMGSHQDTVMQGGKYDGMLGVVLPIACMKAIHDSGDDLPFGVEIVAFGDEEGTRFQSTLVGSCALAGTFNMSDLSATDDQGITMQQALKGFGCNPHNIPSLARDPKKTLGFLEVHIEQGPVLEKEHRPLGVVTAITGIERHKLVFTGKAGHAGTTPMELRRDALVAAAHCVVACDAFFKDNEDLVGVVGRLEVFPGSANVIPGLVEATLEIRSPHDQVRLEARQTLMKKNQGIAEAFAVVLDASKTYEAQAVACTDWMISAVDKSIQAAGQQSAHLFSGAGHDGLSMTDLCPIGMMFVRCKDGLSHHPDESITQEDAGIAAAAVIHFLKDLPNRDFKR